jgi:hypothetical protein
MCLNSKEIRRDISANLACLSASICAKFRKAGLENNCRVTLNCKMRVENRHQAKYLENRTPLAIKADAVGAEAKMNNKFLYVVGIVAGLAFGPSSAQEVSTNRVDAKTDWSVFVEDNPTECWIVSSPKSTVNTRDGRVVAVKRSDILFFVAYRPGSQVKGEISFTGGYPFKGNSFVNVKIGTVAFEFFSDGEWAWPASPAEDNKVITSMKRGAEAVVSAQSSRGTKTEDTFSLLGFTAALEEAEKRCGG